MFTGDSQPIEGAALRQNLHEYYYHRYLKTRDHGYRSFPLLKTLRLGNDAGPTLNDLNAE